MSVLGTQLRTVPEDAHLTCRTTLKASYTSGGIHGKTIVRKVRFLHPDPSYTRLQNSRLFSLICEFPLYDLGGNKRIKQNHLLGLDANYQGGELPGPCLLFVAGWGERGHYWVTTRVFKLRFHFTFDFVRIISINSCKVMGPQPGVVLSIAKGKL